MRDAATPGTAEREFPFTPRDFADIADRVQRATGIVLGPNKQELVYSRLCRRLRTLGLASFTHYRELLDGEDGEQESIHLTNAITTNLTGFYREAHHFEFLSRSVIPETLARGARVRIWSAGCSSGEEAYTIALELMAGVPERGRGEARVLATDIDTNMVAHGRAGIYDQERLAPVPQAAARRWFQPRGGTKFQADPALADLIRFKPLNLLKPWPMRGPFDAIFCRNVMIYFDKPTQCALFDRFADLLRPGGYLFVGHSESLFRATDRFTHLGRTIYRKRA